MRKTHHYVWHRKFDEFIKLTRSEYLRLRNRAKSKGFEYDEDVFSHPGSISKYLRFSPREHSQSTVPAQLPSRDLPEWAPGKTSHLTSSQ